MAAMTITDCPACIERRLHTPADWALHPLAGHGYQEGLGWTHPDLQVQNENVQPLKTGAGTSLNLGGGE